MEIRIVRKKSVSRETPKIVRGRKEAHGNAVIEAFNEALLLAPEDATHREIWALSATRVALINEIGEFNTRVAEKDRFKAYR